MVDIEDDEHAETELLIYATTSSEPLYRAMQQAAKTIAKFKASGQYDEELAMRVAERIADAAAKEYAREYMSPGDWNRTFSRRTRQNVARELLRGKITEIINDRDYPESASTAARRLAGVSTPHARAFGGPPEPRYARVPTNRERALGVRVGPEFRKVRFFSKEHGATAGLVLDASHLPENISAISRLFPSSEFRKMERFQKSPAFETYEDAFSYEFPEPVGTYPKPRARKRK